MLPVDVTVTDGQLRLSTPRLFEMNHRDVGGLQVLYDLIGVGFVRGLQQVASVVAKSQQLRTLRAQIPSAPIA